VGAVGHAQQTLKPLIREDGAVQATPGRLLNGTSHASDSRQEVQRMARKRERIVTGTDKRYVRRDERGRFEESDDVGRSLSQDRRREAQSPAEKGQGDKGDRES
jgi:hypothetical protein